MSRARSMIRGRRAAWALALVAGLPALGALAAWRPWAGPLESLPRPGGIAAAAVDTAARRDGRIVRRVILDDAELGAIGLAVSLPEPLPEGRLPVLVVLGGLGTALKTLSHVPPAGANALVGYDWPVPAKVPRGLDLVRRAPELYRRLFLAPGQIAAAVDWAAAQPWADPERISLLGFSLGAIAAPAAQRLVRSRGGRIGWTVLAYGGADPGALLAGHPRLRPDWVRPLVRGLGRLLLRPLDPAEHLPHLAGRFLVIGGRDDRLVPEGPARRLREATPEPKTVVLLDGAHMGTGPSQTALLAEILAVTERWLTEAGAVAPR